MIDKANTIERVYFANQVFPRPVQGKAVGPARMPFAIVRKLQVINILPFAEFSYLLGRSLFLTVVYD
jgi:hypothetical protein